MLQSRFEFFFVNPFLFLQVACACAEYYGRGGALDGVAAHVDEMRKHGMGGSACVGTKPIKCFAKFLDELLEAESVEGSPKVHLAYIMAYNQAMKLLWRNCVETVRQSKKEDKHKVLFEVIHAFCLILHFEFCFFSREIVVSGVGMCVFAWVVLCVAGSFAQRGAYLA